MRPEEADRRRDVVREIRRALSDPRELCAALGLGAEPRDRQRQAAGLTVRCPRHDGVSCSVTRGSAGGIRVRCFGCGFTGDALHLVAEVFGLHVRRDFHDVLVKAAELAHRWDLLHELEARSAPIGTSGWRTAMSTTRLSREDGADADRRYPPAGEVAALWRMGEPCAGDAGVSALLERRGLPVQTVDDLGLARALPVASGLPRWASFRGARTRSVSWTETGHRLLLPVYDPQGQMRSVRAWCVHETDDPKRLPPAGHRASGLVLACSIGVALLRTGSAPEIAQARALIVEGEPDFLTWATSFSDANGRVPAVLGVTAGAWSEALASRIPDGMTVIVRTHNDAAGDRYAEAIHQTLFHRCTLRRAGGDIDARRK